MSILSPATNVLDTAPLTYSNFCPVPSITNACPAVPKVPSNKIFYYDD